MKNSRHQIRLKITQLEQQLIQQQTELTHHKEYLETTVYPNKLWLLLLIPALFGGWVIARQRGVSRLGKKLVGVGSMAATSYAEKRALDFIMRLFK